MTAYHLRAMAIDDEPMALSIIETFCQRMGNTSVESFTRASDGLAAVRLERPDLLLLDIELGSVNGVALARDIPKSTCIVFTTAHGEFALDGYDLDAADYLMKPFSYERFQKAIGKVMRRVQYDNPASITVKVNYKNCVVMLSDIVYLEAMDNYVHLHLAGGRLLVTQTTLASLIEQLPADKFLRIHKSFVIARRYIERYTRQQMFLRGVSQPISIGRTYAPMLGKW